MSKPESFLARFRWGRFLLEKESRMEALRYPIAGFTGFLADYLVYLLLLWILGHEDYLLCKCVAFVVGVAVNYLICLKFVFREHAQKKSVQILLFFLTSAGALALNWVLLRLAVDELHISAGWANLPVSLLVFVYNFFTKRLSMRFHRD